MCSAGQAAAPGLGLALMPVSAVSSELKVSALRTVSAGRREMRKGEPETRRLRRRVKPTPPSRHRRAHGHPVLTAPCAP